MTGDEKRSSEKEIPIIAFTEAGTQLALTLASSLNARVFAPLRYRRDGCEALTSTVGQWAADWFDRGRAEVLIFVAAAGIAVRAVAPLLKGKAEDPAVLVVDEAGKYVIPLISGHIGGANSWAREIALLTGGTPVVTTATDGRGIEAADDWAVRNDCAIENVSAIKYVSAAMLDGKAVGIAITGLELEPPWPVTLWLRPRNLILGIGCKRGIGTETLMQYIEDFLKGAGVSDLSLAGVASVDLKKDEAAILAFCGKNKLPFFTYAPAELQKVAGRFASSARVEAVVGVDNVCERAAVLASNGVLLRSKTLYPGVTLALARRPSKTKTGDLEKAGNCR